MSKSRNLGNTYIHRERVRSCTWSVQRKGTRMGRTQLPRSTGEVGDVSSVDSRMMNTERDNWV